jgi:hypothetical protein
MTRSVVPAAVPLISGSSFRRTARLPELGEQAADTVSDPLVAVDFAGPAAFSGVFGELALEAEAVAEPRRVLGRSDELGADR